VADQQHRLAAVGPAGGSQCLGVGGAGRQTVHDAQLAPQGLGGLAGAQRRADQHLGGLGQEAVQPFRHALGLLVAARGERARQVGRGVERRVLGQITGFGVAPQDQVHHHGFQCAGAM